MLRRNVRCDWCIAGNNRGTRHTPGGYLPQWMAVVALLALLAAAPMGLVADEPSATNDEAVPADAALPADAESTDAEPPPPPPPAREPYNILTTPRLTGDWGGVRPELEDVGVKINLYYNHFYGILLQGGQDLNNAQRNSATLDLHLFLDFEKMGLIPGGELFVWPKGHFSRNINPKVGALADPFDDADGDKVIYIDVLQYQQTLIKDKLKLRVGYLDQQMAFDRNAYANSEDKQFFNTYLDNDNAIVPLTIGLGAVLFWDPTEWLGFAIGASDGDARIFRTGLDTAFHDEATYFGYLHTELRPKIPGPNGDLAGNYRFGLIYDPRRKEIFGSQLGGRAEPDYERGDYGFYLSFDQKLFRESPEDDQGLGWFCRYGFRRGNVNRIGHFWSTGVEYLGPIPERDKDRAGFGMYQALASHEYKREVNSDFYGETGYELYYSFQLTPWLTFSPDIQYIRDPGGLRSNKDAVVLGFRARVTF